MTIDVDLGISIGTDSRQYESVADRLKNEGFVPVQAAPGHDKNRLIKKREGASLILDLLTDKPAAESPDTVHVEGLWINAFPGIDRALQIFREVTISGKDLIGAKVTETIRVTEIGPFLCLKLNGYAGRAQSKDVFDVVYAVKNYDHGPEAAARQFKEESGHNYSYETAVNILESRFLEKGGKGPMQYAEFLTQGQTGPNVQEQRARLRNEAVDVAILLLK